MKISKILWYFWLKISWYNHDIYIVDIYIIDIFVPTLPRSNYNIRWKPVWLSTYNSAKKYSINYVSVRHLFVPESTATNTQPDQLSCIYIGCRTAVRTVYYSMKYVLNETAVWHRKSLPLTAVIVVGRYYVQTVQFSHVLLC